MRLPRRTRSPARTGHNLKIANYLDIHAHILPGIDDGPEDLEQALAMARAAAEAGLGTIAATPHLRSDFPDVHVSELADRCRDLQAAIDEQGISLGVVCGAEVSLGWALTASDEELALASYNQHGTDLLIETPPTVVGLGAALYELRAKGYRITLAHPERSIEFQQRGGALQELIDQGVLLQVNAESVMGIDGSRLRRFSHNLLTEGLVHALASDGHRADRWRPVTRLAEGVEAAARLIGVERTDWMAQAVPAAIVAGAPLPQPPPIVVRRPQWRLLDRLARGPTGDRRHN